MLTEKQKHAKRKKQLKEKERLLNSNKSICNYCGFIGNPKKTKKGSWIVFLLKLSIAVPVVTITVTLSLLEGLLRLFAFSSPHSVIWQIGFESFFPHLPHILYDCPDCRHTNSMKRLRTQKGLHIYERHERECFIMRR